MEQYANLLKDILKTGTIGEPARANMPSTRFLVDREIRITDGKLPILLGKKVFTNSVIVELLWFLKGDTNIKYLIDNNCNIWNEDAYNYYKKLGGNRDFKDFIDCVKIERHLNGYNLVENLPSDYKYGDCGRIYGAQWRNYGECNLYQNDEYISRRKSVDQISNLIKGLIETPFSRYHIVDAWNPQDMIEGKQALPACHTSFNCAVREIDGQTILDLSVYQRSCDMFLGVPFNLLSYGILHRLLCRYTGYAIGIFVWHGFNCHIYENQIDAVNEYLNRFDNRHNERAFDCIPYLKFPNHLHWNDFPKFYELEIDDITINDYNPMPYIKAPLSTGLIK